MKNIILLLSFFMMVARSHATDAFRLTQPSPFDTNNISTNAEALLGTLKVGMTRVQLNKHFSRDGGINGPIIERYFLNGRDGRLSGPIVEHYFRDDKAADGRVIMIELAFHPAGIDDTTFNDANKRAKWFGSHREWSQPDDVVVAIGIPFMARIAFD
jgi:hypothetical protein